MQLTNLTSSYAKRYRWLYFCKRRNGTLWEWGNEACECAGEWRSMAHSLRNGVKGWRCR